MFNRFIDLMYTCMYVLTCDQTYQWYTLNMCSLLYTNYTSIKVLKVYIKNLKMLLSRYIEFEDIKQNLTHKKCVKAYLSIYLHLLFFFLPFCSFCKPYRSCTYCVCFICTYSFVFGAIVNAILKFFNFQLFKLTFLNPRNGFSVDFYGIFYRDNHVVEHSDSFISWFVICIPFISFTLLFTGEDFQ